MDKHKKWSERNGHNPIQADESQEISFEQFERAMKKIVRTKPQRDEPIKHKKSQ